MTTTSGLLEVGEYKTQGCTNYLPDDIRQGVLDGIFNLEYQCFSGDCDLKVYSAKDAE